MMAKCVKMFILFFSTLFNGFLMNADEYESPEYTRYVDEIVNSFAKKIKKEFGFDCETTGGRMPYDVEEISVSFNINRNATVKQARELEILLTEKFVEIINAHEKIRPFLRENPFPASRAIVMLSFYKPTKAQALPESVELVYQAKNTIFYRVKDPANPYIYCSLHEEPYEEALKIVQSHSGGTCDKVR